MKTIPKAKIASLLKHNDIFLAVGIALIISMLLLPVPPFALDVLLSVNIALAITIMMVTIYTNEPLQYSTFPIILLVATLFRLGLNVSATRLILTKGEAGEVIHAFGNFVVGGNYLVGILIFIILVVINFIVITNGAGRVAEVAARFTLDAMPGKQLSIDADLNAGLINEEDAKRRRSMIQREADFYGTMDGASKFVKGDAIAAIIITVINIIGGLIVGVFQLGQPIEEAVQHFTVLTVGDGLVSQMPALIISAATGILVTRVSDEEQQLGDDIQNQMFANPKILGIVAALMGCLSLIPGLPMAPFMFIALLSGGGCYLLIQANKRQEEEKQRQIQAEKVAEKTKKPSSGQGVMDLLQVEALEVEIGYRLVSLLEPESGGDLLDRIAQIRRQVATELGMVLPSVRVRDNLQLQPNVYNIKIKGIIVESGEVRSDMMMAMNTEGGGNAEKVKGIPAREPAFGLPATWIYPDMKEDAEMKGYTVVSPSAVVATHLSEVIKKFAPEILTRQDVQILLDNLKKTAESLVEDLIPDQLSVAEVHIILQNLLTERVSIRDLGSILEALSYHSRVAKDKDYLTEQCRMALSRSICKQYIDPVSGELPVVTLAPDVEETMAAGLTEGGELLALSPAFTQGLLNGINREIEQVLSNHGVQPVLLCNSKIRLPLKRLIERMLPQIGVLSYNEIGPTVKATAVGMVQVEEAAAV